MGGHRLDGVQNIDPGVDKVRNDAVDRTAGMEHNGFPVLLPHLDQALEAGQDKGAELFKRHEQVALGAEVVYDEEYVEAVAGLAEKPVVRLHIEIDQAVGGGVDDLRVGVHADEVLLHAEKVAHVVEKGAETAREHGLVAVRADFAQKLRIVKIGRVGPGIAADVVERRFGETARHGKRFALFSARKIEHGPPAQAAVTALRAQKTAVVVQKLKQSLRIVDSQIRIVLFQRPVARVPGPEGVCTRIAALCNAHHFLPGSHSLSSHRFLHAV